MKKNKVFFAFAKGNESGEAGAVAKRFIGVASVNVLGVNPTAKEIGELTGFTPEKEPEYVTMVEVGPEGNKRQVAQTRLDFYVKPIADKYLDNAGNFVETVQKMTFFLRNTAWVNGAGTKVQVIDKYGRTAWATKEENAAGVIPTFASGNKAQLSEGYRPAFVGEEALTKFIRTYLGIPAVMRYDQATGIWSMVDKPEDSEARLDNIADYFKGNVSEIKGALALQPTNKVKVLFGIRTTDDGKQYQTIYTDTVLNNRTASYDKVKKEVEERITAGYIKNTEFVFADLTEYVVVSTNMSAAPVVANPFGAASTDPFAAPAAGDNPFGPLQ